VRLRRRLEQCISGSHRRRWHVPQNLPLARYTVEAWHEKFGVKTLEVTAPARVIFAYDGSEH